MSERRRSGRVAATRPGTYGFNRLPQAMEEFEVLWDLNGRLEWWTGELLEDPTPSSSNANIFIATLRYRPRRNFTSVDYEVSFPPLSAKCGVKRLQHTSPSSNELTPWKFPEESVDKARFARIVKQPPPSPPTSLRGNIAGSSKSTTGATRSTT